MQTSSAIYIQYKPTFYNVMCEKAWHEKAAACVNSENDQRCWEFTGNYVWRRYKLVEIFQISWYLFYFKYKICFFLNYVFQF